MANRKLQPCGTDAAYQRHHRYGQPIDQACADAHRETMNRIRENNDVRDRERTYSRLRQQALEQLANEDPIRFTEIFRALRDTEETEATPS
jgi:hypothetical protein